MTKQSTQLQNNLTIENWKEEFSRAKQYHEATQKRSEEKRLQKEIEHRGRRNTLARFDREES